MTMPQSAQDFRILLEYLGVPVAKTFELADSLRIARIRARSNSADGLDQVVARANLAEIEGKGLLRFDAHVEGFSGVVATKVLAVSPVKEIVPRNVVRVVFPERGVQWPE